VQSASIFSFFFLPGRGAAFWVTVHKQYRQLPKSQGIYPSHLAVCGRSMFTSAGDPITEGCGPGTVFFLDLVLQGCVLLWRSVLHSFLVLKVFSGPHDSHGFLCRPSMADCSHLSSEPLAGFLPYLSSYSAHSSLNCQPY
jgi:hypothetical protein